MVRHFVMYQGWWGRYHIYELEHIGEKWIATFKNLADANTFWKAVTSG